MDNKVRDDTGELMFVYPLICRLTYIKPVLAASAGVGGEAGSAATPRSSDQPPGPREALGDVKTTVFTEEAKISFELYLSSQLKVRQAKNGPSAITGF